MSVEAISWALKQQVESSSAKFVLVVMANCADGKDFVAWPSLAYLSEATGQDEKTVQKNIKLLREIGYLIDTGERSGRTKQIIVYQLNTPENGSVMGQLNTPENGGVKHHQKRDCLKKETPPIFRSNTPKFPVKHPQISGETPPKTGDGTVRNRQGTVKEPYMSDSALPNSDVDQLQEKISNAEKPPNKNARKRKDEAIALLNMLNARTDRHFRPTETTLKPIIARLREGFTLAECKGVLVRKCRQWGSDDKMREYLRPETLFGATKFSQYVGEVPPPEQDAFALAS